MSDFSATVTAALQQTQSTFDAMRQDARSHQVFAQGVAQGVADVKAGSARPEPEFNSQEERETYAAGYTAGVEAEARILANQKVLAVQQALEKD